MAVTTNHASANTDVMTVKNNVTVMNFYIRHGMIIRDLDDGKNWKLKVAIPEQTLIGTIDELSQPGMLITPAL